MPLHLLSKKSWNVYNPAAIERVRADEAAAAAREEANEQRLDEYEAAKRLAILRGQTPPPPPTVALKTPGEHEKRSHEDSKGYGDRRKRRRVNGEDDTDRDIRFAREDEDERKRRRDAQSGVKKPGDGGKQDRDVPLLDHAGHIQLFAPPSTRDIRAEKDAEKDFQHKRKEQEKEDRVTMRFSNAAGFGKGPEDVPWYTKGITGRGSDMGYTGTEEVAEIGKDAFGNDDSGRPKRNAARISAADPMAVMVNAQRKLKEVEREREARNKERRRDLEQLAAIQENRSRREARRKKSHGRGASEEHELEGFSLDGPDPRTERRRHQNASRSNRRTHSREDSDGRHRRHSRNSHRHQSYRTDRHRESY